MDEKYVFWMRNVKCHAKMTARLAVFAYIHIFFGDFFVMNQNLSVTFEITSFVLKTKENKAIKYMIYARNEVAGGSEIGANCCFSHSA